MAQQTINVGAAPNDGTGTPLRTAFQYTNSNFSELYTALGGGSGLPGATTQVIFNDGGTNLAGDAGLVYNKTTDALTIGGNVQAASATITGDLTVDTSTLKVDSTNNRVGVNTASPANDLEVRSNGSAEGTIRLYSVIDGSTASPKGSYFSFRSGTTGGGAETAQLSSLNRFSNVLGGDFSISTANTSNVLTNRLTIDSSGVFTWSNVGGVAGTAMTLNSTGLGIGTTVLGGQKLAIGSTSETSATASGFNVISSRATITATCNGAVDAAGTTINYSWANGGQGPLIFRNAAISNVMTLDASGNVGIGVTPSVRLDLLVADAAEGARFRAASGWLRAHPYLSATDGARWQAVNGTNTALINLSLEGLNLRFNTNAGNAMILDNLGNIILSPPTTPPTLGTNGQLTFTATSNTNLRFSYRGSDGITRVANLTLA